MQSVSGNSALEPDDTRIVHMAEPNSTAQPQRDSRGASTQRGEPSIPSNSSQTDLTAGTYAREPDHMTALLRSISAEAASAQV